MLRGIRGAATVATDTQAEIWQAAQLLITEMLTTNGVEIENVGAIIFTSTNDLKSAFPTAGLRKLQGFNLVPLFDAQETFVEGSLPRCIRALMLVDIDKNLNEIRHIYLGDAQKLRPDLK